MLTVSAKTRTEAGHLIGQLIEVVPHSGQVHDLRPLDKHCQQMRDDNAKGVPEGESVLLENVVDVGPVEAASHKHVHDRKGGGEEDNHGQELGEDVVLDFAKLVAVAHHCAVLELRHRGRGRGLGVSRAN